MSNQLRQFFSSAKGLTIINAFLLCIAVLTNIFFQVFCIPSTWSLLLLILCFTSTIFYPIMRKFKGILPLLCFINGISICVFIYCVLFLGHANYLGFLGLFILGIGSLTFIPHFFIIQIFWINVIKPAAKFSVFYFIFGILIFIVISLYFGYEYKNALSDIKRFKENNFQQLHKSFMTEKILGMHFIYHTRYTEYDGWRPPIHEPALVIGMWLNGNVDPLGDMQLISLDKRIELYKKFYPQNKLKYKCSCAIDGSSSYHKDERLQ